MTRLATADASKMSGADFLRALSGKPPQTEAEKAEADARRAWFALFETVERAEYLQARREREKIIREGMLDGETYDEWNRRLNSPFYRAAKRVNAFVAGQRRAA